MAKIKPLGKVIITKINEKPALKNQKLILQDSTQKELQEEDAIKDAEFYCTLQVLEVGPDVRKEIKPGTKILISASRLMHLDRIVYKGIQYHTLIDSESTVPAIIE